MFKRSKDDDTAFDHFLGIRIDDSDQLLDQSNYVAEKGSVVVTLLPDYLETLDVGKHKVSALFDDGNDVIASFSILEPDPDDPEDPDDPVDPEKPDEKDDGEKKDKEEESGDPTQPEDTPDDPDEKDKGEDKSQDENGSSKSVNTKSTGEKATGAKAAPKTGDAQHAGALLIPLACVCLVAAFMAWRKRRDF